MKKWILIVGMIAFSLSGTSCMEEGDGQQLIPIAHKALEDTLSIYYGHYDKYPEDISDLPIGIFDSSTDGLCVLEKFLTLDRFDNITGALKPDGIADFAGESFQYLADNANGPYRSYVLKDNLPFLKEQVLHDVIFLMGKDYYNLYVDDFKSGVKEPVKNVVIASDVASIYAGSEVEAFLNETATGVTSIGIMQSAMRAVLEDMREHDSYSLGILSPANVLTSKDYETAVRSNMAREGISSVIQIFNQEAVGLDQSIKGDEAYIDPFAVRVRTTYKGPVIGTSYMDIDLSLMDRYNFDTSGNALLYELENGRFVNIQLNSVGNYVRYHLVSLVERHRRSGSKIPISSILLSSYRYPSVKDTLNKIIRELYDYKRDGMYLYRNSISENFKFIDPVEYAVMECYTSLREAGLLALSTRKTELSAFVSVPSYNLPVSYTNRDGSLKDSLKTARIPGTEEVVTKIVPFAPRYVDIMTMLAIEKNVPFTYSLIRNTLY